MSEVSITINKRSYTLACDDGQEEHLRRLAANVDGRVGELVAGMGQMSDQHLLVMASLLLADELEDLRSENTRLQDASRPSDVMSAPEAAVVRGLDALAGRIEEVAHEIEKATLSLNAESGGA